jgi:hypothetical protein
MNAQAEAATGPGQTHPILAQKLHETGIAGLTTKGSPPHALMEKSGILNRRARS